MRSKIRILFVYTSMSSFVRNDLKILQKHFKVYPLKYTWRKGRIDTLKGMLTADVSFSWFARENAFFLILWAKLLGKKSIIVTGGYDVANMPEINYGVMASSQMLPKIYAKFALRYADTILAFSDFSKKDILRYTSKKVDRVYIGFNHTKFKPSKTKEHFAITIAFISKSNISRKGIETFVKSANYLPNIKFVVIGKPLDDSIDYLKSIASSNVEFVGYVTDDELIEYMQRAKVYVQVSAREGFGCSVAESMLCGCIPVVTNRGALPEVVGDTGLYVPYSDPKATAEAIEKALKSSETRGMRARERIKKMFPLERRERELLRIVEEVIS